MHNYSQKNSRNIFKCSDDLNVTKKFTFKAELFPVLTSKTIVSLDNKYSNLINTINNNTKYQHNNITIVPGWTHISKTNNIINKSTNNINKSTNKSNLNNEVNHMIDNMINNWNRYEEQYNEINGENAYQIKFYHEMNNFDDDDDDDNDDDDDEYDEYEY